MPTVAVTCDTNKQLLPLVLQLLCPLLEAHPQNSSEASGDRLCSNLDLAAATEI